MAAARPEPAADDFAALRARILSREARVAVIGLGYVGLPLALAFVDGGFRAVGCDIDASKLAVLRAGCSPVGDVPDAEVAAAVRTRRFTPTSDPAVLAAADCILICVPTPLRKTREPDISAIVAAAQQIRRHLRPGQLVVLESTTYPGTTDEVLRADPRRRGLAWRPRFLLAFSPERVDPGDPQLQHAHDPEGRRRRDAAAARSRGALREFHRARGPASRTRGSRRRRSSSRTPSAGSTSRW